MARLHKERTNSHASPLNVFHSSLLPITVISVITSYPSFVQQEPIVTSPTLWTKATTG